MHRLVIAITGASGICYGVRCLEAIRAMPGIESHLVMSPAARRTLKEEMDIGVDAVEALADVVHAHRDIGAAIASGSFQTIGMIVAPCTVRTLSGIAHSYDENLIVRAADVCLKERRRLVLLLRETPLHAGHIELMAQVTRNGAIVMPPAPAFYHRPRTLDDIVDHTVGRALDLVGIDNGLVERWTGTAGRAEARRTAREHLTSIG